jgi:hypothetical protein
MTDNRQLGEGLQNLKRQFVVKYNQEYFADQGQTLTDEDINWVVLNSGQLKKARPRTSG